MSTHNETIQMSKILLTSSVSGPGVGGYVVSNIGLGASSVLPPVLEGVGTFEEAGISSTIAGVGLRVSILSIAGVGLKVPSVISAEGGVGPDASAVQVVGDVGLALLVLLSLLPDLPDLPEEEPPLLPDLPEEEPPLLPDLPLPSLPPDLPDLPLPKLPPPDFPLLPVEHVLYVSAQL